MPAISLIQMVSSCSVDASLRQAEVLILEAAKSNPDAIFLPENFAALGAENPMQIGVLETNVQGPIRSFIAEIAQRTRTWIFAGTVPIATRPDGKNVSTGKVRAASIVVDESGTEVCRYDKMHMFDVDIDDNHRVYRESETFESGTELKVIDSSFGKVGLSVCYDIRFPELYRNLTNDGAIALAIPSAFTETTGKAHFQLLMRARAVENSCFTIAACQGGVHDSDRRTYGHSMVVDPWGEVIAELDTGEAVLSVELDLDAQTEIRRKMPFLSQRQLV